MAHRTPRLLAAVVLAVALLAGCAPDGATVARLEAKAERAKSLIVARAEVGEDVAPIVARMHRAKAHFDRGEVAEGEAILDSVIAALERREPVSAPDAAAGGPVDTAFGAPRRVTIAGYDEALGAMEPFITRDGRYLVFNSQPRDGVPPDLHYAERVDELTFRYRGPVRGANSPSVDGAPSLDANGQLYFVSPRDYAARLATLHTARFVDGGVSGLRLVAGDVAPGRPGMLNMDAEISADGRTLYYCINEWNVRHNIPKTSDLRVAHLTADGFVTAPDSREIFAAINSDALEYAPALSADERELYFTRARFAFANGELVGAASQIMVATRATTAGPFGTPRRIASISGFVEGPTIAPDGRRLYYHRRDGDRFRLYLVARP